MYLFICLFIRFTRIHNTHTCVYIYIHIAECTYVCMSVCVYDALGIDGPYLGGPGAPEQYFASNGKRHCTVAWHVNRGCGGWV